MQNVIRTLLLEVLKTLIDYGDSYGASLPVMYNDMLTIGAFILNKKNTVFSSAIITVD